MSPDIKHMAISHDGKWLATVEEWMQPVGDTDAVFVNNVESTGNRRMESFLKIWAWRPESKQWELVTRIDRPHPQTSSGSYRILDLATDPEIDTFSTVGEDKVVRFWAPKTRSRNNVVVKDAQGEVLVTWTCHHSIQLPGTLSAPAVTQQPSSLLAYSPDGSVLAVSEPLSTDGTVYLINTCTISIASVLPNAFSGMLQGLALQDRYLILLSSDLRVYDLVTDKFKFGYTLSIPDSVTESQRATFTHLAAQRQSDTLAIVLPALKSNQKGPVTDDKLHSQLIVFSPSSPQPITSTTLSPATRALLPSTAGKGYIVIDTLANIRTFSPGGSGMTLSTPKAVELEDRLAKSGLQDIYGPSPTAVDDSAADVRPLAVEGSEGTVQQKQLADIFDVGPAFALPGMGELFEQVVGLFARKQTVAAA